jgi:hypothetical protein
VANVRAEAERLLFAQLREALAEWQRDGIVGEEVVVAVEERIAEETENERMPIGDLRTRSATFINGRPGSRGYRIMCGSQDALVLGFQLRHVVFLAKESDVINCRHISGNVRWSSSLEVAASELVKFARVTILRFSGRRHGASPARLTPDMCIGSGTRKKGKTYHFARNSAP